MRWNIKQETSITMDVHPKYPIWLPGPFRKGWQLSRKINQTFGNVLIADEAENLFAVEGHITRRQCATLFYLAYTQPGPGRIVEIGSFKGKSTVCMAMALKIGKRKDKVVAIDPHINTNDPEVVPAYKEESSYDAFLNNISSLGLDNWVEPVKDTSEGAAKGWNQPIELLFIDGSHRYEDVLMDLQLWEPQVIIGGVICMHDTMPSVRCKGVRRAIDEYITGSKRFKKLLQLKNMTVFEKLL